MAKKPTLRVVGSIATYEGLGYKINICDDQIEIVWNMDYIEQHDCESECFESAFAMLYQMKKLIK